MIKHMHKSEVATTNVAATGFSAAVGGRAEPLIASRYEPPPPLGSTYEPELSLLFGAGEVSYTELKGCEMADGTHDRMERCRGRG